MDFLRRQARCSRLEKKERNTVIREEIDIKNSVLDYVRYKQLNWYRHVRRMDEEEERNTSKFVDAGSNNWNQKEGD